MSDAPVPALRPPFDYRPQARRPEISWPGGARVAVWVGVNIEHYPIDKPAMSIFPGTATLVPDPLNYGWRDYGVRVGIWRMIDMFDELGIPVTVLLNSAVCDHYPEIIDAGRERGWAWMAHGRDNATLHVFGDRDEERDYLGDVVAKIEKHTGRRPRGWLGPGLTETFATPGLLAEMGLNYVCDWCNDDQPYSLTTSPGPMVLVPYSIEVNDVSLILQQGKTGAQYQQVVIDQFEALYEAASSTGQVMCVPLHPFIMGQPFRLRYLRAALAHIASAPGVWLTTADEIADHYIAQLPT